MNNELIDALQLVPQPFRDNPTMVMIMELFNALMDKEINAKFPNLNEIQYAYYDATYKLKDYSKISFGAKRQLMSEMGFDYITDFINISDKQLTELLIFLNLIYALKGKKEGLELILNTLDLVYEYTVWDETSPKGVPFTATLVVTGGGFEDFNMFKNLKKFLRSYMLPWIDIVIEIVVEAPPMYIMPSCGCLTRLLDSNIHSVAREVDQRVAIYDIDDGHGYDNGLYGRDTEWLTGGEIPAPPPPQEYCTFTIVVESPNFAIVEINGQIRKTITVEQYDSITWRVYTTDGTYVEQSGYIPQLASNTTEVINLKKYVEPTNILTLSVNPTDATIKFNGLESGSNNIVVKTGTTVSWEVSKQDYETQSGTVLMTRDELIPVTLVKNAYTVKINVTTSGVSCTYTYQVVSGSSLVYQSGNTFKARPNTIVKYTIKPNDTRYKTYTNSITVTKDQTINVALVAEEQVTPEPTKPTYLAYLGTFETNQMASWQHQTDAQVVCYVKTPVHVGDTLYIRGANGTALGYGIGNKSSTGMITTAQSYTIMSSQIFKASGATTVVSVDSNGYPTDFTKINITQILVPSANAYYTNDSIKRISWSRLSEYDIS